MKLLKSSLALVGAASIFCSVYGIDEQQFYDNCRSHISAVAQTVVTKITELSEFSDLDTTKVGYGQGTIKDDKNRPVGATDFNARYGMYDATAIGDENEKVIYLTFDQGYENGYTETILDTLKEKNVKATFFVVGDYARRNGELVRRMIDEGHTVGNHSMSHYSMPDLTPQECEEEINSLHSYVLDNFDYEMTLFRPPMGEFSEQSLAVTQSCGYRTMLWSFAYCDWDVNNQPDAAQAKAKLIDNAHNGAVYLLHSVSSTNAQILGEVIDELRAKGYSFG